MSLRTLLKKDPTHFLVKYTIDKKTQIRTRGLLKTEDEVCLFYCIYISIYLFIRYYYTALNIHGKCAKRNFIKKNRIMPTYSSVTFYPNTASDYIISIILRCFMNN